MQPGRVTTTLLNLHRWKPGSTAARAICMYMSADQSAASLAILHGSQLTILSVHGMFSHSSADAAPAASISTDTGTEIDYADITLTIQPSKPVHPQTEGVKRRQPRTLRVFAACVGPPAVLPDKHR